MNTSYSAMTVKEVIGEIADKRILVPEFLDLDSNVEQEKVETLFEDILNGYPIGGFTFWNLEEPAPNIMFYELNRDYDSRPGTDSQKRFEMGFRPFRAVLDGQNRLNYLLIGLTGTYTDYTEPENKGDDKYPPRTLYLNLRRPETPDPARAGKFKFLTEKEYGKETQNGAVWVKAGRILDEDVPSLLASLSLPPEAVKEAEEILSRLADGICSRKIVGCTFIEGGPLSGVLDLLDRERTLWEPDCSKYLFYLLASEWDEAKPKFERLEKDLPECKQNYIMRFCVSLIGNDYYPSVEQFAALVPKIKKEWGSINFSIRRVHQLFEKIRGKKNTGYFYTHSTAANILRYWFYKKGVSTWPNNSKYLTDEFETAAKRWMLLSRKTMIRRDISELKKIIDETDNEVFPFAALKESIITDHFRKRVAEDGFEEMLTSPYEERFVSSPISEEAEYLLALLGSGATTDELGMAKVVHLHPRSFFEDREKLAEVFKDSPDDLLFAADPKNWNSVLNLCLMPLEKADMKERMSLEEWAEKTGTSNGELCVDDGVSLDIKDFRAFIENRRKKITAILRDVLL